MTFEEFMKKRVDAGIADPHDVAQMRIGWNAAMEEMEHVADHHRAQLRNGGAINACKYLAQSCRDRRAP